MKISMNISKQSSNHVLRNIFGVRFWYLLLSLSDIFSFSASSSVFISIGSTSITPRKFLILSTLSWYSFYDTIVEKKAACACMCTSTWTNLRKNIISNIVFLHKPRKKNLLRIIETLTLALMWKSFSCSDFYSYPYVRRIVANCGTLGSNSG